MDSTLIIRETRQEFTEHQFKTKMFRNSSKIVKEKLKVSDASYLELFVSSPQMDKVLVHYHKLCKPFNLLR